MLSIVWSLLPDNDWWALPVFLYKLNPIKAHWGKGSWPFSFERSATFPPQADHVLVDLVSSMADKETLRAEHPHKPSHSKWLTEQNNNSASNFALSLNILLQKLFAWLRRPQLWATGDGQLHHDNEPAHTWCLMQSFFVKYQITQVTQPPYSPDLVPCDFWLFPKLKSPLKGKRCQTIYEIQEDMTEHLMATGRTVWGPKVPTLKETEASLSYIQCFLHLLSSSINVSIFHITWTDTFWTDLIYLIQVHTERSRIVFKLKQSDSRYSFHNYFIFCFSEK